jgi:CRISPR-associated protein Cas4
LQALPVFSEKYGLFGKIDEYHKDTETLIERKYKLKTIYQGQIYQLWAQVFCLREMGYQVSKIAFYEISTNKTIPITLPTLFEKIQFESFIQKYRQFNPIDIIETNPNKCRHCIYCNLCDKTEEENVY